GPDAEGADCVPVVPAALAQGRFPPERRWPVRSLPRPPFRIETARGLVVRAALLVPLLSMSAALQAAPPKAIAAPEPLEVVVRARPSTAFVGEPVEVSVGVVAGRDRPTVSAPAIEGASVNAVGTSFRPISVSGIGTSVLERNLYRFHYRLVP